MQRIKGTTNIKRMNQQEPGSHLAEENLKNSHNGRGVCTERKFGWLKLSHFLIFEENGVSVPCPFPIVLCTLCLKNLFRCRCNEFNVTFGAASAAGVEMVYAVIIIQYYTSALKIAVRVKFHLMGKFETATCPRHLLIILHGKITPLIILRLYHH